MSLVNVNEDIDIVNVDESWLRQIKVNNNTLDNGAMLIVDGLRQFIDNQLEVYKDFCIPYEDLFVMLKQIIECACENDKVRDALMTGIISNRRHVKLIREEHSIKKTQKLKRDKKAITDYAKNHTVEEIADYFSFSNKDACRQYLITNKIDYLKKSSGRPRSYNVKKLKECAENMTLTQTAAVFGIKPAAMAGTLKRYGLKCKGCRK